MKDVYLENVERLEPNLSTAWGAVANAESSQATALISAAISLKRIADALQPVPQITVDPEGFNGCMTVAALALDYLADHDRPIGGESTYNAEHLMQIASELRRTSVALSLQQRN